MVLAYTATCMWCVEATVQYVTTVHGPIRDPFLASPTGMPRVQVQESIVRHGRLHSNRPSVDTYRGVPFVHIPGAQSGVRKASVPALGRGVQIRAGYAQCQR